MDCIETEGASIFERTEITGIHFLESIQNSHHRQVGPFSFPLVLLQQIYLQTYMLMSHLRPPKDFNATHQKSSF